MSKSQTNFWHHFAPFFLYCPSPKSQPFNQVEALTRITEFSGLKKEQPPCRDCLLKVTLSKVRRGGVLLKLPLAWRTCAFVFSIKLRHIS